MELYEKAADGDMKSLELAAHYQEQLEAHDFYSIDTAIERVANGLGLLAIGLDRSIAEMSGGQRAKVILAKLLLEKPDVLLLDEPTTYLDIAYQVEILDLLTELNRRKGTTIVMILHDVNLSARYADHLFALCRGKLIAEGKPADVITEELMQKVYQLNCIVMKDPLSGAPLIVPKGKY